MILLFSLLVNCLFETKSILFSSFVHFSGEFSMGWKSLRGYKRVGQTKLKFEINHWDRYVNQALALQMSPLHLSLEKYGRCTRKIFFIVTNDVHQRLRSALRIFYSGHSDSILVWNKWIGLWCSMGKIAFGCLISYFLVWLVSREVFSDK